MERISSASCSSVIHPVSVGPGSTELQVTPKWANSWAAADVIRSTAPLLAPYGRFPMVWSLVRLTIRPPPCCPRNRSPYSRISSQEARALTAKCRSKLSTVVSNRPESTDSQWQSTSAVTFPSAPSTLSKSCAGTAGSLRSASTAWVLAPKDVTFDRSPSGAPDSVPHRIRASYGVQ